MAQTDEERQASNVDAHRPVLVAVLDSGATIHVFSDEQFLSNIRNLRDHMPIQVADGRLVYVDAVGEIDTAAVKLKNVHLARDLKMNLVSVRELAKSGITTTFYKDYAELKKGTELVGGAIARDDNSLYELRYLWATGDGDASTTPAVPSGSERLMMTAVNGPADAGFLMPKKYFAADDFAVHYGKKEFNELMPRFNSLDDTVKPEYIAYSTLLSKFYQSDKAGAVDYGYQKFNELMSKFKSLDNTVKPEYIQYSTLLSKLYQCDHQCDKTGAVDYGYQKFNELMSMFKSLENTVKPEYIQYSTLLSKLYQSDKTGGGVIKTHFGPDPLIA